MWNSFSQGNSQYETWLGLNLLPGADPKSGGVKCLLAVATWVVLWLLPINGSAPVSVDPCWRKNRGKKVYCFFHLSPQSTHSSSAFVFSLLETSGIFSKDNFKST